MTTEEEKAERRERAAATRKKNQEARAKWQEEVKAEQAQTLDILRSIRDNEGETSCARLWAIELLRRLSPNLG